MEIHTPHEPVQSWPDVMRHLAIITAGVLIALALEGVVAWADHRLLVREAADNLRREITDNAHELEGLFAHIAQERTNLEHADEVAQGLLDRKPLSDATLTIAYNNAELKNAGRTTAEVTGAFGYMAYAEVEKYASIYGLQEQFNRAQDRVGDTVVSAFSSAALLKRPEQADAQQLQQWQGQIRAALGALTIEEQLGQALQKRYRKVMEDR
jgi:hypothetical protein